MQQESCENALVRAQDAHHQALAAAAMQEGHIEWLSHSISHGQHGNQGWSDSQQHSCRRCTRSHRRCPAASQGEQVPSVVGHMGDPAKRQAASPSPIRPRRWVTFEKSSLDSDTEATPRATDWSQPIEVDDSLPPSWTTETADWSQPEEKDLRGLAILQVVEFLCVEKLEDDPGLWECPSKPSFDNAQD